MINKQTIGFIFFSLMITLIFLTKATAQEKEEEIKVTENVTKQGETIYNILPLSFIGFKYIDVSMKKRLQGGFF